MGKTVVVDQDGSYKLAEAEWPPAAIQVGWRETDDPDVGALDISTEDLKTAWDNQIPVYYYGLRLVYFEYSPPVPEEDYSGSATAVFVNVLDALSNFPPEYGVYSTREGNLSELVNNTDTFTASNPFSSAFNNLRLVHAMAIDHNKISIICSRYQDTIVRRGITPDGGILRAYVGTFTKEQDAETQSIRYIFEWTTIPYDVEQVSPLIEALIKDKLLNTKIGEDTLFDYLTSGNNEDSFNFVL